MDEEIGKIDAEPKWINLVPQFITWIESGNETQRKTAKEMLEQMAKISDAVRQFQKGNLKPCPVCGGDEE